MNVVLINAGYLLMLSALLVRDILWLRAILIAAQSILMTYALQIGNQNVAFWNGLFVLINTIQVIRLIRERRPIKLSDALEKIYQLVFSSLQRREFLYIWHMGNVNTVQDSVIIQKGKHQKNIALILDGIVEVKNKNHLIALLSHGSFVAEMSFLTGNPATADVNAQGSVKLISWPQIKLRGLQQINPDLFIKLQSILGKDLTQKINPSKITS